MTDQSQQSILARGLKDQHGFSLLELMAALVITGILASSFLGTMVLLSRISQKSRTILQATAAANNRMERLKSFSLSELAQLSADPNPVNDHLIIQTEIERYDPVSGTVSGQPDMSQNSFLDLVIKSRGENGFFSYLVAEDLQELVSLTGTGNLHVSLEPEDGGVLVRMSDTDAKTAAFHYNISSHSSFINIFTQHMSKGQQVQVNFDSPLPGEWAIRVYEQPFPCGTVQFRFQDDVCVTDQQLKQIEFGGISIETIKQDDKGSTLVYLQVEVYTDPKDDKPVSACHGVIKVPY